MSTALVFIATVLVASHAASMDFTRHRVPYHRAPHHAHTRLNRSPIATGQTARPTPTPTPAWTYRGPPANALRPNGEFSEVQRRPGAAPSAPATLPPNVQRMVPTAPPIRLPTMPPVTWPH